MNLPNHFRQQRGDSIPDTIRHIGTNNAIVSQILYRYVAGEIVTHEEMLCQCVLALAEQAEELRALCHRHLEAHGQTTTIAFHGKAPE